MSEPALELENDCGALTCEVSDDELEAVSELRGGGPSFYYPAPTHRICYGSGCN